MIGVGYPIRHMPIACQHVHHPGWQLRARLSFEHSIFELFGNNAGFRFCDEADKMDPVSALGLVGAIIGVVDVISRNISSLIDLQSRYKSADLKVGLLIGQLSTLKAALKQIIELMNTSLVAVPQHQQLLHDLKTSLDCCEVVILVLDERLCCLQRREDSGLNVLNRVQFLWDEKSMTDYLNLLNNQINALNLLLTALQWLVSFFFPFTSYTRFDALTRVKSVPI
jgi:hypothetical protein